MSLSRLLVGSRIAPVASCVLLLAVIALVSSEQNYQIDFIANNQTKSHQIFIEQLLKAALLKEKAPQDQANNVSVRVTKAISAQTRPSQAEKLPISRNTSSFLVKQRWLKMELALGESIELFGTNLKLLIEELLMQKMNNISLPCEKSLADLTDGLIRQQLWAAKFIDSSGYKLPSGLLEGTLTELGNFDQCLSIRHDSLSNLQDGNSLISGQYCSIQIKPPIMARPRSHTICQRSQQIVNYNNQSSSKFQYLLSQNSQQFHYAGLRLGLCLPSKCTKTDLRAMLASLLSKYELISQVKSCQSADQVPSDSIFAKLDTTQQCLASLFLFIIILTILGTLCDICLSKSQAKLTDIKLQPESQAAALGPAALSETTDDTMESLKLQLAMTNQLSQAHRKKWQHYISSSHNLKDHKLVDQHLMKLRQISSPEVGLQKNPLAKLSGGLKVADDSDVENSNERILAENNVDNDNDDDEDEDWLAELEKSRLASMKERKRIELLALQASSRSDATKKKRINLKSILICFSLRKNLQVIGKHARKSANLEDKIDDDVKIVHGLRTFAMIWIVFGHSIGLINPEMMNNLFALAQLSCSSRLLQAILNATLAVDTFFMISGFVTVISFIRKCPSASKLVFKSVGHESRAKLKRGATKTCKLVKENNNDTRVKFDTTQRQANSNDYWCSSIDDSSSIVSSSIQSATSNNKCLTSTAAKGSKRASSKQEPRPSWPDDFEWFRWILLRYFRLTPAYAAVIGLTILLPLLGSGPFWAETVQAMDSNCRANYYYNLLYINNFYQTDKLCLIHSWYLSNDFQFFLLSLLLFGLFYKSKKLTLLLLVVLLLVTTAATFVVTVLNDFPPTIVTTSPAVSERWLFIHSLYYKPWPHLSSYLVGLITGFIVLKAKARGDPPEGKNTSVGERYLYLGWLLASVTAFSVINSVYPWNMGLKVDPILTGLHSSTFRLLWACCCAWLIYALIKRPQNFLAKFLAWHGFQISSRLTYCTYLIHPLIIYYHFGTLRERMDSSIYGQLHHFVATLSLSYLGALLLTLLIESPSVQLLKLLLNVKGSDGAGGSRQEASIDMGHGSGSSSSTSCINSWTVTSSFNQMSSSSSSSSSGQCKQHQGKSANQQQQSIAAQLDADFQKKLAQAIGRGFRIRSKIAMNETSQMNLAPATSSSSRQHRSRSVKPSLPSTMKNHDCSLNLHNNQRNFLQQPQQVPIMWSGRNNLRITPSSKQRAELKTFQASNQRKLSLSLQQQQQSTPHLGPTVSDRTTTTRSSSSNNNHRSTFNADEMILAKKKLLSRSQSQTNVKSNS